MSDDRSDSCFPYRGAIHREMSHAAWAKARDGGKIHEQLSVLLSELEAFGKTWNPVLSPSVKSQRLIVQYGFCSIDSFHPDVRDLIDLRIELASLRGETEHWHLCAKCFEHYRCDEGCTIEPDLCGEEKLRGPQCDSCVCDECVTRGLTPQ